MDFIHVRCLEPDRRDRIALRVFAGPVSVTYGGLAAAAEALARTLRHAGIGRGARVGLLAPTSVEFVVGLLATLRCGAAAAPIDSSLRGLSLTNALDRLAPDALIGVEGVLRRAVAAGARLDGPRAVIAFRETAGGPAAALAGTVRIGDRTQDLNLPLAAPAGDGVFPAGEPDLGPDDDALLIATSGSTGLPKFVRLGHRGTVFNATRHLASLALHGPFRALQVLDISYSYGLVASLLGTLLAGGTLVLPSRTDAAGICDALAAERPAVCLGSPAMFDYLIDGCPAEERAAIFGCLTAIGIGGDRCRETLRHRIRAAMPPQTACYITYGTTEAGPRIATLPPDQFLARPHSVGLPLDGVEIAILDAEGRPCVPGETGLLHVRTPSRMNGYLGDPPGSSPSREEWLPIRDLASVDEAGFLTIHGRADRQFKHRGRRINPAQIELVLERFPGVVAVRVEPAGGDDGPLRAVVHYRPVQAEEEAAADGFVQRLREHCRRNLPNRLVPGEIVTVAESDGYFFKGRRLPVAESMT